MWKTRLTLSPGSNGTKKLTAQYGERLVCVRYRYDPERHRRIKTVELIEEERPWTPEHLLYLVEIRWEETILRERAKHLGARWNPTRRLWQMDHSTVKELQLSDRIRDWIEPG